jgi:hypothetical protein
MGETRLTRASPLLERAELRARLSAAELTKPLLDQALLGEKTNKRDGEHSLGPIRSRRDPARSRASRAYVSARSCIGLILASCNARGPTSF